MAVSYTHLIRAGDGAEAVGDDQHSLSRHQPAHGLLDHGLVLGVYISGRLVQHHNGRVLQETPGDGDALLLPAGKRGSSLANYRAVSLSLIHI